GRGWGSLRPAAGGRAHRSGDGHRRQGRPAHDRPEPLRALRDRVRPRPGRGVHQLHGRQAGRRPCRLRGRRLMGPRKDCGVRKATMGENVEFPSNGDTAGGYLARAPEGAGPGVIVLQEWWGLDSYIKGVCEQLAGEGFTALAPDLYHGELAKHTEMDKAAELMNTLPPDRSARDMGGAVNFLLGHEAVRGHSVGAVGFCMGGMLSMLLGAQQGDKVGAVVAYYGMPLGDNEPDWSNYKAPTMVHVAGNDDFFPPEACESLGETL